VEVEDTDTADAFELPGRDLSGEELTVRVIPKRRTNSLVIWGFLGSSATQPPRQRYPADLRDCA